MKKILFVNMVHGKHMFDLRQLDSISFSIYNTVVTIYTKEHQKIVYDHVDSVQILEEIKSENYTD